MHIHTYTPTHIQTHIHTPIYIPPHLHIHTYPYTSISTHIPINLRIHAHPYIHPCIPMHTLPTHTHTHRALWGGPALSTHSVIHTHLTKLQALSWLQPCGPPQARPCTCCCLTLACFSEATGRAQHTREGGRTLEVVHWGWPWGKNVQRFTGTS